MAKPKKRSKGRQKSKAALATEQARAEREGTTETPHGEAIEYTGGGGMMTKMRGGFQNAVGSETGEKKGGWLNTVLWIAVIGAGVFFFMSQYR
tara:strand:+ start:63 stop:341 length:279 start_codon:yes stop_codon:yes gene_type:complete